MNKKMLREALYLAIQDSNETDVKMRHDGVIKGDTAKYYRLSGCLAALAGQVRSDCPDVSDAIMAFLCDVIQEKNPLLDAADSNKEKPE